MSDQLPPCPGPPEWKVDWSSLTEACPWLDTLRGCMQDTVHHGEGDVYTHTQMVCEAMAALPAWRGLQEEERSILFAAAVLHDIAKPLTRKEEPDGHISFHGHSRRGAIFSRKLLWHLNVPFAIREQVIGLIRHHLAPFHLIEREDSRRKALEVSQLARCDRLAILAEADARGRICQDLQSMLDNISLFTEECQEQHCWHGPYAFPSAHGRFLYFQQKSDSPEYVPHEDFRCEVVLMSGMPGVGKDHWIREHLPGWAVISLDNLREEMGIPPQESQGAVLQRAKEMARTHLREKRSFVWNATCLSRQMRSESIRLFAAYDAWIRIVYLEVPVEQQRQQNQNRPCAVPFEVVEKLLRRWEVPDLTEAHQVDYVVRGPGE